MLNVSEMNIYVIISTIFVALVGIAVLGLVNPTLDCSPLSGYDSNVPDNSTGWAKSCLEQKQFMSLSILILIVIIALLILVLVVFILRQIL